jgi:hypothetical protein
MCFLIWNWVCDGGGIFFELTLGCLSFKETKNPLGMLRSLEPLLNHACKSLPSVGVRDVDIAGTCTRLTLYGTSAHPIMKGASQIENTPGSAFDLMATLVDLRDNFLGSHVHGVSIGGKRHENPQTSVSESCLRSGSLPQAEMIFCSNPSMTTSPEAN